MVVAGEADYVIQFIGVTMVKHKDVGGYYGRTATNLPVLQSRRDEV
jgi:hypothetical protein